jgi:hypothetical protein
MSSKAASAGGGFLPARGGGSAIPEGAQPAACSIATLIWDEKGMKGLALSRSAIARTKACLSDVVDVDDAGQ